MYYSIAICTYFSDCDMVIINVLIVYVNTGILLPKLFWPTVRKKCSSDREKLLKFEAEGWEFAKCFSSLEEFIQTVKGQNIVW